jgi:hypothetical protein
VGLRWAPDITRCFLFDHWPLIEARTKIALSKEKEALICVLDNGGLSKGALVHAKNHAPRLEQEARASSQAEQGFSLLHDVQ